MTSESIEKTDETTKDSKKRIPVKRETPVVKLVISNKQEKKKENNSKKGDLTREQILNMITKKGEAVEFKKYLQNIKIAYANNDLTEYKKAEQEAKEVLKIVNDTILSSIIQDILSQSRDKAAAFKYYINHYKYQALTLGVKKNKDGIDDYIIKEKESIISLADLLKEDDELLPSGYNKRIQALLYNFYCLIANESNDKVKPIKLSNTVQKFIQNSGYENGGTINKIQKQANDTLAFILPEGLKITLLKKDIRYLGTAIQKTANGVIEIKTEKNLMNELIVAMYHRLNDIDYDIVSKSDVLNGK